MAIEPELHGSEPVADAAAPDASFDRVLDAVRRQLREALDQATRQARREVEAAAEVVTAREVAAAALEASLVAERESLQSERIALTEKLAAAGEHERRLAAELAEATKLKERAGGSLADALERSARVVEEAEARVEGEEADAQQRIEAELAEAQRQAEELRRQADTRLAAARAESAAMVERAVERGLEIMSEAETAAAETTGGLRDLAARIDEFLKWQAEAAPSGAAAGAAVASDEAVIDLTDRGLIASGADGTEAEASGDEPGDDGDGRVVDAVRRAVRGWVGTREKTD